ncbi:uncharacterized protein LOC127790169 [Diospyros lotus]|uniref:uncharacterized protein LOC127790169 n=1 Tax=Diospyros lotus TaxID=55363 RepID=UPI00224ECAE2|nr:uncharacterized protein LOC127790169 [Diospyros lotus]
MRMMVAVDESEGSFYALNWALNNFFPAFTTAEELGTFTVVHVQQPFQPYIFAAGPVLEVAREGQEKQAASISSRALEMCKGKMVKAETLILEGDPKEMICQATEKMQVDVLVVGSRGLSTIKRAFLGSVSDYCAHHAKCPILIVKPPSESHNKK